MVMDAATIEKALFRISHEIVESNREYPSDIVLLGIPKRGDDLAKRLQSLIKAHSGLDVALGILDITFHRDDLSGKAPIPRQTAIPGSMDGKVVILVDDVLFTGRSTRAAMDALVDWGRPRYIRLAVLVDRGHRELPVKADYVGKNIPTKLDWNVKVELKETDGRDQVTVEEKP